MECETVFTAKRLVIFELQDMGSLTCGFTGTRASLLNVFREDLNDILGAWKLDLRQSDFDTKKKKVTKLINKGQCFEIFMPIVYEKNLESAIQDGILSDFETTIIQHTLGTKHKDILISKKNDWKGSEEEYYNFYRGLAFNRDVEEGFKKQILMFKLPRFLYNLKSKITVGKKILECLPRTAKTLIFAKELDFLEQITPWVARESIEVDDKTIKVNELLDMFDVGEITELASSQRLQRGVTLKGLNTLVLFISGKQPHILQQVLGRLVRFEKGKIGHLIIVVTQKTFEEKWLEQSCQIKDYKGDIIETIDLRVKQIISSKSLWLKNFRL